MITIVDKSIKSAYFRGIKIVLFVHFRGIAGKMRLPAYYRLFRIKKGNSPCC